MISGINYIRRRSFEYERHDNPYPAEGGSGEDEGKLRWQF